MLVVIVSLSVCDVINFEINLSFIIKPLFYMTKNSGQKSKYLKNKKSISHKIKNIFHDFKGVSSCQKLSQTQEWTTFKSPFNKNQPNTLNCKA